MDLFEEIRRGYAAGETIKGVAKKHGVHRCMVRQAVASAIPPLRKKPHRPATRAGAGESGDRRPEAPAGARRRLQFGADHAETPSTTGS